MKTRPILFNAPMVRAILSGTKTQTRRVVKQSLVRLGDGDWYAFDHKGINYRVNARHTTVAAWAHLLQFCPYGQPGDRLWVRETCRAEELESRLDGVRYLADAAFEPIENTREAGDAWVMMNHYRGQKGATVTSIHMPRWASRILLEVVSIRVEQLQDISGSDCTAEGIVEESAPDYVFGLQEAYRNLWNSINGPGAWESNPWVWVVEFKRVTA